MSVRASLILVGLAASTCIASPLPKGTGGELKSYDVSYQDGRTSSLIGRGVPNANGLAETGDPDEVGPAAYCFDRDNPPSPEVMAAVESAMQSGYQGRYLIGGSWNGIPNSTLTLTWSFVPDGLSIPGGAVPGEATAPSILFSRMDSLFGAANRALWIQQFQSCFDRWSALSGVTYVRVHDSGGNDWDDGGAWGLAGGTNRGQIRIAMHALDGANGVLAYCQFPTNGDMVIDSSENWAASSGTYRFLRNVVAHEHGHGLGFQHVCPANQTKLMEPFVSSAYDGPQQDDMRAIEYNYGDAYEPNNSPAAAYDLGTLAPSSVTSLGNVPAPAVTNGATLCISTASDTDYFKLTVADPRLIDVTLTPIGSNYAMYPQDANCNNGVLNDNSLTAANLNLTVYNSNGTTVLRSQDANVAGTGETISGLLLASGLNYIKVASTGLTEAQLYKLTITVRGTNLAPTASDGTFSDHVHITWPAIADATSYQVYRNATDATFGGSTLMTIAPPTTSYDDMSATPGQAFFYFVKAQQPGNTGYRFMTDNGNAGYIDVPPTANAGPDQVVVDTDNNGSQAVTLDGSASFHTGQGTIVSYRWDEGASFINQSSSPITVTTLPLGLHTITLTVTDGPGFSGTDTVTISVVPPSTCGSADFNCDGDVGTDADIESFFACISGTCPSPPCNSSADFNHDGDVGTDSDIEAFFRVLGGGTC
jgi:hypothetical protein